MDKLLKVLENNGRLSNKELATMLGMTEQEVAEKIEAYEHDGTIRGYKTVFDKQKLDDNRVTALIEVKVHPKLSHGFEQVANRIAQLEEVETLYLMSGGFDLAVIISGKTFEEVATFVSRRLAPIDDVISTATHFMLKGYKDSGFMVTSPKADNRGKIRL